MLSLRIDECLTPPPYQTIHKTQVMFLFHCQIQFTPTLFLQPSQMIKFDIEIFYCMPSSFGPVINLCLQIITIPKHQPTRQFSLAPFEKTTPYYPPLNSQPKKEFHGVVVEAENLEHFHLPLDADNKFTST